MFDNGGLVKLFLMVLTSRQCGVQNGFKLRERNLNGFNTDPPKRVSQCATTFQKVLNYLTLRFEKLFFTRFSLVSKDVLHGVNN